MSTTHATPAESLPALGPPPWRGRELGPRVGATRVLGDCVVHTIDTLEHASERSLCFARDEHTALRWLQGPGAALLVSQAAWTKAEEAQATQGGAVVSSTSRCVLIVPDCDLALVALLQQMPLPASRPPAGVHERAIVHLSASVDPTASIGPGCVVEARAHIGPGCVLLAQCYVGEGASIGARSLLHPGVKVLASCVVGEGCQLHAGAVLGADGFGYRPHPQGKGLIKIPHVGNVVLGNDVEIGANTCIDRGKFGATTIGSGSKIDNLVQISHNVTIGRGCIICGNAGIAGSVTMGDGVVIGGAVNMRDNITIGSRAQIAAASSVAHNVPAGETWIGMPAQPVAQWNAGFKAMLRLAKFGRAAFAGRDRT